MIRVPKDQAHERIEELLDYAARGEEVVIEAEDGSQFTLKATKTARPRPQYGSAKDTPQWMSDDFDEPLEDFEEYMS